MSGHSKWATIKRDKAKNDAARGQAFTKLIKEITVAAREGGGSPDSNPRLRTAILAAKGQNMPADNIKRAIQKGTGELPGVSYEEITYEGYGPGGIAVLVQCLTDNKLRTVSEVRHIFSKYGGSMAEAGAVSWMFQRQGQITVAAQGVNEEQLFEAAVEAGAENIDSQGGHFIITTPVKDLETVRQALEGKGYKVEEADMVMNPSNTIPLDEEQAAKFMKLFEAMDENDDVQKTWANFEVSDEVLAKLTS